MEEDTFLSKCLPNYFTEMIFFLTLCWVGSRSEPYTLILVKVLDVKAESSFTVLYILFFFFLIEWVLNVSLSNRLMIALEISQRLEEIKVTS